MLTHVAPIELAAALDETVAEALSVAGVERPPISAIQLARRLGFQVAWDQRQRGRARLARLRVQPGRAVEPSILLRPEPREERRQWAVAHEIGEQLAAVVFDRLAIDPREANPCARESIANQLAGRLLLPTEWFHRDALACNWELLTIKHVYTTASHELIARRMLEFDVPTVISIFDHGRLTFRRSNVPGRLPPISDLERAAWQAAHDHNVPTRRTKRLAVQVWPVHEPEWKREIVRLALGEDSDFSG